jgi:rhodanese-related sulfurtransferase
MAKTGLGCGRSPTLESRSGAGWHLPATEMAGRCDELPRDKLIVLYCWDTWCSLATTAAVVLADRGYRVKELFGGVAAWDALKLPREIAHAGSGAIPKCAC